MASDAARWKATVFVGGLSQGVTSTHLYDAFLPFGEIVEVQLPKPDARKSTDSHRGFAYVEFEDPDDALEAIDNMHQSEFFGKILNVSEAKIPKSADEGLSSRKAVWEQVCRRETSNALVLALISHNRKAGWQNSQRNSRKDQWKRQTQLPAVPRQIPCRVLRDWMSRGQSQYNPTYLEARFS